MKLSKIKLTLTKYRFKTFQLLIGTGKKQTKYNVAREMIVGMKIIEDYDHFFAPYWQMDLMIPNKIYREMLKKQGNVTANILLQKGKFKEGMTLSSDEKISFKMALKGKFRVVTATDGTVDLTEKTQKEVEKSGDEYGQQSTVSIALYGKDFYDKADLVINNVMANSSIAEDIAYLLTQSKIKNVLMSPLSNTKKYDELALPPLSVKDQLERLQDDYNIHKKGTLIFFGIDRAYIIDKTPQCTAFKTGEYKITYIVASSGSAGASQTGGCYAYTAKKCNVLNATNVSFSNKKEYVNKALGKNTMTVSGTKITKTNKKSNKVTKVLNTSTPAKEIKRVSNESKRVLTANFRDIDFSMLTPNKQFIVTIDDAKQKKYNGKYRLSYLAHTFTNEGDYLQINTVAEFMG